MLANSFDGKKKLPLKIYEDLKYPKSSQSKLISHANVRKCDVMYFNALSSNTSVNVAFL